MNKIPPFTLLLCALLLAAVPAGAVGAAPAAEVAATFRVTKTADTNDGKCDSDCSLREAVIASSFVPGSTVVIPAGDYYLTLKNPVNGDAPNIEFVDGIEFYDLDIGWNVTISGAGAGATRIHGGGKDRVFQIGSGAVVTIQNVTILDGFVAAGAVKNGGGAISNQGTLTLNNCVIRNNKAETFGGAFDNAGTLTLYATQVIDNQATGDFSNAGGIYNAPLKDNPVKNSLTLQNSTLAGNSAKTGGGLFNSGTAKLTNTLVQGNASDNGGGIFNNAGASLTVLQSALVGNAATATVGGGVDNQGAAAITNTTISGNQANSERAFGGGIVNNGALTLNSVTLVNNTAPTGAAIYNKAKVDLVNTILSSGDPAKSCELPAPLSSQGRNLDNGNTCGLNTGIGDQVNTDPKLGPLAMNGGFTPTHALLAGSPAIDKGTCVYDKTTISTDQRGVIRPGNGTATRACDIGAFEIGSNLMVFIPVVVR